MKFLHFLMFIGEVGLLLSGCDRDSRPPPSATGAPPVPAEEAPPKRASPARQARPETLLNEPASAYAANLLSRERELIVTTPAHAYRIIAGKAPERIPVQLGRLPTLYEDSIAFFREGRLRAVSLADLKERVIARVEGNPQYLLSSGRRLAWLSHEKDSAFVLQAESAGLVKTLYSSTRELIWPVLHEEAVYFLEHIGNAWRIGRAPLDESHVTFGKDHEGRVPPMLAAGHDGLYFYDGPKSGVRRVSFDLQSEERISAGTICAPLAVSTRVVCAQVGGVIEITRKGAEPRTIAKETSGPIAQIAATDSHVYWIVDRGPDRMTVRSSPLPPL